MCVCVGFLCSDHVIDIFKKIRNSEESEQIGLFLHCYCSTLYTQFVKGIFVPLYSSESARKLKWIDLIFIVKWCMYWGSSIGEKLEKQPNAALCKTNAGLWDWWMWAWRLNHPHGWVQHVLDALVSLDIYFHFRLRNRSMHRTKVEKMLRWNKLTDIDANRIYCMCGVSVICIINRFALAIDANSQ